MPVLIAALNEDNEEIRQIATGILGKIGKEAVPALTRAIKDDAVLVRRQALLALAKIGTAAQPAVPQLVQGSRTRARMCAALPWRPWSRSIRTAPPSCRP